MMLTWTRHATSVASECFRRWRDSDLEQLYWHIVIPDKVGHYRDNVEHPENEADV